MFAVLANRRQRERNIVNDALVVASMGRRWGVDEASIALLWFDVQLHFEGCSGSMFGRNACDVRVRDSPCL